MIVRAGSAKPWDQGLQPERTALAWRRTALALCAGLVIAARTVAHQVPWLALELPVLALAIGIAVARAAHLRSRRLDTHLRGRASAPGGRLILVACVLTLAFGLAAVWWVLTARE
jgi:uncharacterized membrane protein YidH (DUF202 family)